jgi:hypothetical protein
VSGPTSRRNGSVRSDNWFDVIAMCGPDHTGGAAPGTTQTLPTLSTLVLKRVRVQIPAT